MVEIIGLTPLAVGSALASPMWTPGVSCSSPHGFATEVAGSSPMRQLLIWWAEKSRKPPARSGTRCIAAMNASRSSPRRQRVPTAANGTISSAPAAAWMRIWAAIEARATRTSTASSSE